MAQDYSHTIAMTINRLLSASQTLFARILYLALVIALFLRLPSYLPFPDLAFQCLIAIALCGGILQTAGLIRKGFQEVEALAEEWPRGLHWIIYVGMLGASLFTPVAVFIPLLFAVPSLNDSPLHSILVVLGIAGCVLLLPTVAIGLLVVLVVPIVLAMWLPIMAFRTIRRKYSQRLLYEQYSRSREVP